MRYFAVRRKTDQVLLAVFTSSTGDAEFAVDVEYVFTDRGVPYLFASRETAERAISENTPWYNAGPDTPRWGAAFLHSSEVEVVEVKIVVDIHFAT